MKGLASLSHLNKPFSSDHLGNISALKRVCNRQPSTNVRPTRRLSVRNMIVLLSPAKTLDLEKPDECFGLASTRPTFAAEAEALVTDALSKLDRAQLKALLGVSDDLAKLNHQRYQEWHAPDTPQKACILAFNGPAYQHLLASEFTQEEAARSQSCVRILSGLYGLLRPLDLIKPYRLDMGRKLRNSRGVDLYSHWGELVTEQLNRELAGPEHEGSRFIVNCASQEYFKVVQLPKLQYPVYHCLFPGVASVFAKQARGAMVRYIVRCGAADVKTLQGFTGNSGEYVFDSTAAGPPEKLAFKRVAANAPKPQSKATGTKRIARQKAAADDEEPDEREEDQQEKPTRRQRKKT